MQPKSRKSTRTPKTTNTWSIIRPLVIFVSVWIVLFLGIFGLMRGSEAQQEAVYASEMETELVTLQRELDFLKAEVLRAKRMVMKTKAQKDEVQKRLEACEYGK